MGKTRMTAVDLRAAVSELSNKLVGQRLVNVYDINPKMYLLKFSGSQENQKDFVVIEVGSRIHSTTFQFDKPKVPSGFTLKIRKHIRQWRLDSLRQLGCDRVIEFTFGSGEKAIRLVVEFYAKGNLILSDAAYNIMALVRTHATEDAKYAVRATYPTADVQLFRAMTRDRMEAVFKTVEESGGTMSLKTGFANATEYGPAYVEHCLLKAGLRPNFKKAGAADQGRAAVDQLLEAFAEPDAFLRDIPQPEGYLIRRLKPGEEKVSAELPDGSGRASAESYEDFAPVLFKQHEGDGLQVERFTTFNDACDYYFSALDQTQIEVHNEKSKKQVLTKVEKAVQNHRRRLEGLQKEQEFNLVKAQLIEDNIEEVEAALAIIRSAIGQGIDWAELARVVKEQKRLGNPIASMIHELKLEKNKVSLLLTNTSDDADDTEECQVVDIDIGQSAHANARAFFATKKKIHEKEVKTQAAEGKAMKSAERKAEKEKQKESFVPKKDLQAVRKVMWFEKFHWFISSENYLVLAGRDMQQNELLVKRYLKKGDIYVHADLHGAATTIIKNPTGKGVPSDTLYQAGNMAVCRSAAWESNIVISAWWVFHTQVSKTAPSGEYMPTGSFMIRGKKNFLPPTKLQMGAGILFRVHEENVAAHKGERRVVDELDDDAHHSDSESGAPSVAAPSLAAPSIFAASEAPSSIHCNKNLINRYGLGGDVWTEDGRTGSAPEPEKEVEKAKPELERRAKPRISAKDRRAMKKGGAAADEGAKEEAKPEAGAAEKAPEGEEESEGSEEESKKGAGKKGQKQRDLTRAEKRKARKMKKYQDQDDDERELRMRVCGWNGGLKAIDEAQEEETQEEVKAAPVVSFEDDAAFKKDWRRDHDRDGTGEAPEEKEVAMELELIDHLTGRPAEDDLILHPMLMVGPLEAVEAFKFSVSVMPGREKKGKAAQQLLHHLSQSIVATEQERDHIKRMDMTMCINLLPSNLRIVTDAAAASKAKHQKPSKAKRR
eukprot:TRINITY_DN11762_c3_g1_i2.p1 TRINITY_DN11762_c3_g1~~TRINITY_DN11762_c3_g1_i2.p1  ORF type:complete len:1033 (+),score=445.82 TRINITY_DN11762_c3_g1_i2:104-3100(+)